MFVRIFKTSVAIVLAALLLLFAACNQTTSDTDSMGGLFGEKALTGDLSLPDESQRTEWTLQDGESATTLNGSYADMSLSQVMSFMDGLADSGWYLTGNSGYKDNRSINLSYTMDTEIFKFHISLDKTAATWPQGVLTPYLRHVTPPFHYGTFDHSEETFEGKAEKIVYTGVANDEINDYLDVLKQSGFEDLGENMWVGDMSYVSYEFDNGVCGVIVAMAEIGLVPLPPWPDSLPAGLVRILPPVGAVISITQTQDGFVVVAEQTTLSELYGFVSSAAGYGWSELSDENKMTHSASGSTIQMVSYSTGTNAWELTINSSLKDEPTDNGGLYTPMSYGYKVTQSRYSEEDAMLGVLNEFGQYAEMADWNDIKLAYGDDFAAFLDDAGVNSQEDVWAQHGGERYYNQSRHYFLAYVNGTAREGFLKHDQVGDIAWLGSWYDIDLRVLVKVPSDQL